MKHLALIISGATFTVSAEPLPPKEITSRQLCAATLILEAGGEIDSTGTSRKAMQAIWEIVWRRAELRKLTPLGVVTQRKQFSCLNSITPGRAIATAQKHPMWRHAWGIVSAPPVTQLTGKADHYHATTIKPPYWADATKATVTIGRHKFYRLGY